VYSLALFSEAEKTDLLVIKFTVGDARAA